MRLWLKAILKQFPKELTKFDSKWAYSLLVAVAIGVLAYRRMGKERFMSEYFPTASGAFVGLGVMFILLLVRSAYSVYKEADDRATSAEKTLTELAQKPRIDLVIKEAFIIPKRDRVAECFVYVSLQNSTLLECKPTEYAIDLRIKGTAYSHTSPLELDDYIYRDKNGRLAQTKGRLWEVPAS